MNPNTNKERIILKLGKFNYAFIFGLSVITFFTLAPLTAHASYLNGNDYSRLATHLVKAKRTVKVYKVHTGNCEANNRWTFYKYLHKGSKVYSSAWFMSTGGRIIKSKNMYYHNSRTFFIIPGSSKWYTKIR